VTNLSGDEIGYFSLSMRLLVGRRGRWASGCISEFSRFVRHLTLGELPMPAGPLIGDLNEPQPTA
jgi:hypothetical protein